MTPARLLTEQNVTRSPFSWPYRQTDQGVRPYNATRGPFGAHQNVAKRGNSVRATPSLHPHARKAGGKQKPFSNPKKGEPKPTRQTINFSGQLSSSPRSKIVVVEQEAEFESVCLREGVTNPTPDYLSAISWVFPSRPLTAEVKRVAGAGYLRGGDLWHVACALFVSADPSQISFLTLDERQKKVSRALGFAS